MADHLRLTLTVADRSDDTEDEKPEEHISSVAQQQDKEQADHHGYHQAAAKTQTRWELSQVLSVYFITSGVEQCLRSQMSTIIHKNKWICENHQKPEACLHKNPVPGVCIILKDLHANLVSIQEVGNTSVREK